MKLDDLSIVQIDSVDENTYNNFVTGHSESMLYHSLPYIRMIASITGGEETTLAAVDKSNTIRGVLPIIERNGLWGRVLNSLPYYGSHGGILASDSIASEALVNEYNKLVLSDEICTAMVVGNPLSNTSVSGLSYSITDYRIGQFTCIDYKESHAEQLMQSFHSKTRNMIRKGEKSYIRTSEENNMVDFLMRIHFDNMKSIGGRAKSETFFRLFPRYFQAGRDYKIFVARIGGEPVAALLLFYFRNTVEYFMPVICEPYREKQPLSLLIYHAMIEASERGFSLWNWGGTWAKQEGVYHFKKRWGTYDINYKYYIQVNNQDVFNLSRETILEQYPDFFVVPFNLLTSLD